ncbi:MAG: xylulokinase [Spirochaetales bacterium]|nr:MAG: xylulokinase [Spirochaetales bacterium]
MIYFLGIDIGTTGCKVSAVNENGRMIISASREYSINTPFPGWAEQSPESWWTALMENCREINEKEPEIMKQIEAVSLCGQMHTQVLLDRHNTPLRPAITWMDQRSSKITADINSHSDTAALIISEAQNPLTSTYTAAHLKWIQNNEPEVWQKTSKILIAKDYLKFLLTGEYKIDFSEASGTLLFNNQKETWSEELCRLFAVPLSLLPELGESTEVIGMIQSKAANLLGLKEGIPVVNGSTDNSAAALGGGMTQPGEAALIIGTAGVVSVCSDKPLIDPEQKTLSWHYCLPERWINLGVTQTAGESLNWFKESFDGTKEDSSSADIFREYNSGIKTIPDGCEGLIFLPYLNGERTPHWDSDARSVFFGIGLQHTKNHFIKAIMEGVSFALRDCVESVEALGIEVERICAVGGGLKSPVWRKSLARILARPIHTVERPDTGNIGNAILAATGTGVYDSVETAAEKMIKTGNQLQESSQESLEIQYLKYKKLYRALRPVFHYKDIKEC